MVRTLLHWTIVSSTVAALTIGINFSLDTTAIAKPGVLTVKPNQTTPLEGVSSGPVQDKNCAGFIAKKANHVVRITTASNLSFNLEEGASDATLLILGKKDQRFCVQADPASKGKISIPGRWEPGNYDVFVGSRGGKKQSYKLTISPLDF